MRKMRHADKARASTPANEETRLTATAASSPKDQVARSERGIAMEASLRAIVEDLRAEAMQAKRPFVPPTFDLTLIGSSDEPSWKADDRAWFEAHPHRSMRFRARHHDEDIEIGGSEWDAVLVKQYSPGLRQRRLLALGGRPIIDDETFCIAIEMCCARGDTRTLTILQTYQSINRFEGAKQ